MNIIQVLVDDKSFARMQMGLRVEGTVGFDTCKGMGDLNAFNRKRYSKPKDKLVKKLPWGWVKKSLTRVIGRRLVDVVMHRELKQAMSVLEIEEIMDNV